MVVITGTMLHSLACFDMKVCSIGSFKFQSYVTEDSLQSDANSSWHFFQVTAVLCTVKINVKMCTKLT